MPKYTKTAKKEAWRKTRGRCAICGCNIDKKLKRPHPMSLSIDHIIPQSAGGKSGKQNLQVAHAICNSRRGNGPI